MNVRSRLINLYMRQRVPQFIKHLEICHDVQAKNIGMEANRNALIVLLDHAVRNVPYYRGVAPSSPEDIVRDPYKILKQFPLLTKPIIRSEFKRLSSSDLATRKWYLNTSGGSTGEPVQFVQDSEYADRARAVSTLYSEWAGKRFGESEIYLWGSERDIFLGTQGIKSWIRNKALSRVILNAFRMPPERMREYIRTINEIRPRLIVAYAQAIYEVAKFARNEQLRVLPQHAIMTSAGTLYEFMRKEISEVFQAPVFNRYGSREVGDIAAECSEHNGLHVGPLGTVLEIVDDSGDPLPSGIEGNIAVTSLTNFAMPLIRYCIGDRGVLTDTPCPCGRTTQMLRQVLGRTVDCFVTGDGTLIDGEFFTHLLYFRPWLMKFQVVQLTTQDVEYYLIKDEGRCSDDDLRRDLSEIEHKTKLVLGEACSVAFKFVHDIPPSSSGKFRYTISEVERK